MRYADLHIHSIFSDGTYTPEEIVTRARARGAALISVCDHNAVAGTLAAEVLARAAGLGYIRGVEIDALHRGVDVHILCYGADLANEALLARIRHARARLDEMSAELLRRMRRDYSCLSQDEYEAFPHDSALGGWKMLQYMKAKGVTPDLRAGFAFYERYGVRYADAGFDSAEQIITCIHAAGGRAVLAHAGVTFAWDTPDVLARATEDALDAGFDGAECYYPRHDAGVTRRLLDICARRALLVTAGSDCHGAFNRSEICQTRTPLEKLRLGDLV